MSHKPHARFARQDGDAVRSHNRHGLMDGGCCRSPLSIKRAPPQRTFLRDRCEAKATTSCLECHEARIIVQQRLSKAAWTKEVDKMVKWGAVVEANDRDALIDYLSTNFSPDQPPYEPPRTSSAKKSK